MPSLWEPLSHVYWHSRWRCGQASDGRARSSKTRADKTEAERPLISKHRLRSANSKLRDGITHIRCSYHHIPLRGAGCIDRRDVVQVVMTQRSNVVLGENSNIIFPIGTISRMLAKGMRQVGLAATRCQDCAACKRGEYTMCHLALAECKQRGCRFRRGWRRTS
jgi:hypothetical protein